MAADDLGPAGSDPLTCLSSLGERGKEPASKSILNAWVNQAQARVGLDTGRLGWLGASTVVVPIAHEHWSRDYSGAATAGGVTLSLADAVSELNTWIAQIDAAK